MLQFWWKSVRWMATAGAMLWFIILPLISIYGLWKPWRLAEERLSQEGFTGFPLMIGAGSQGERRMDSSGDDWREARQRSYIVIPESFRQFAIFTYSEVRGSNIAGVEKEVIRSSLLLLVVPWILAGVFTAWQIRRWLSNKERNQSPQIDRAEDVAS